MKDHFQAERGRLVQASVDRILTTHVGSLPRPAELASLLIRRNRDQAYDPEALEAQIAQAVADVVGQQVRAGLDVVNDGEMSKPSYATYIQERLSGFGEVDASRVPAERSLDREAFPEYYDRSKAAAGADDRHKLACTGSVALRDSEPLRRDLANLEKAAGDLRPAGVFMTAASPGVVARFHPNLYYETTAAYRDAIGAAMRQEYEAIVAAGFILQVDCPDLASGRTTVFADRSDAEFIEECEISIGILNEALRNVPRDRVRLHLCWGNYEGPHIHDIALEKILPTVLTAKAAVFSFEGANPRHAHEWEVWRRVTLPDDAAIMPGVIDSLTNYVEHPRLVAQRIRQYADAVGRERVIAAADCGFETFIGSAPVDPAIVYAKLAALSEGARIASDALWK
jgi:5-methyltetrahydropteroyltriglutamate--homocysteine methyltransferase